VAAQTPPPVAATGTVSVVVTVLRDLRVARTLESLLAQRRRPDEIIVADGGQTDEVRRIAEGFAARDARVHYLFAPGNIPESRNVALRVARGEFVAFLDADEVAPPQWLEALLKPFDRPRVGFVGGPTPALPGTAWSVGARYYDAYLRRFYDRVARHRPHALPMGNSAWRASVFRDVGTLDTSLDRRAPSEDQDIALRALARGWEGVYAPDAWVHHDFSDLTVPRLMRKQRVYAQGGYVVWRRRRSTYEARGGILAVYLLPPLLGIVGAALLVAPGLRGAGEIVLVAAGAAFGLLALALTLQGFAEDRQYPGFRFRVLEILRRYATLYGAFRGLIRYGWRARGSPGRGPGGASSSPPAP
jgi:glycosyltransferase involved in cell wall biosynthesis